jgi:hypothetical protein
MKLPKQLFFAMAVMSVIALSSCGNRAPKAEDIGPFADTNAGKPGSPGYDAENGMTDATKDGANGTFELYKTVSGKQQLQAVLVFKNNVSEDADFSITFGTTKKATLKGKAVCVNDMFWTYSSDEGDCSLILEFDGTNFTVKYDSEDAKNCAGSKESVDGVYKRK